MKQAVLLLAHGAPERLDEVDQYLLNVRGGRPLPPHVVEEIRSRYAAIGGGSPLLRLTNEQARALQAIVGVPVYAGMRNWTPYIRDAISQMAADGVGRAVAICMAPQYSNMSVGFYFRRAKEALEAAGAAIDLCWVESFHVHPKLIAAFAERLRVTLDGASLPVLFTAHSLPEKILTSGDPYDAEVRCTAAAVAAELGLSNWDFAYQSQGLTEEKWLGPTVESRLDASAAAGVKELVIHPIGFVCDHVEILYDVDILFRNYAARRGIAIRRPESLNDSPLFIEALAELAKERLG
ncbi:MAG TPA: ferrochelatase [Bryobacterales bacterium]|nr:ferrochelatase [Bryobacterales bacterium]